MYGPYSAVDGNIQNQKDFPSLFPKCSDHIPDLGQCTEQIPHLTFTFQSSIEGGQGRKEPPVSLVVVICPDGLWNATHTGPDVESGTSGHCATPLGLRIPGKAPTFQAGDLLSGTSW